MGKIDDSSYKNKLMEKILDIVEEEDYGPLEEKRRTASDFSYKYKKESTIEMLIGLYEKLGKHEEELRLARYKLEDKEDYVRLANVLMEENRFEEAFDAVKKGLALPGERHYRLIELYFDLAGRLLHEPGLVDFSTSLEVAFDMLDRQFDKKEYEVMKQVFSGTGKLEEFKSALQKSLKNRNSVVHALLHDGELKAAIDVARSEPRVSAGIMIEVSKAARDKGMVKESSMLTRMVLERGWADDSPPVKELIRDIYKAKVNEAKWLEFIRRFVTENKGKKKLIERVRKEFGVVL